MNLFSGHPSALKESLISHIRAAKTSPLDAVLLVLPSQVLAADIKRRLAKGAGCFCALHCVSFFELAKNIYDNSCPDPLPVLRDEGLQNFILKNIQAARGNTSAAYVEALKSTLKDLTGAGASPEDLLAYTDDPAISLTYEQRQYIRQLAVTFKLYLQNTESPRRITYGQLMREAANMAEGSGYLAGFKKIIFYGFYDLTGVQSALLDSVRESFEIDFFVPYEPIAAYNFCKNFYELRLLPYAKHKTVLDNDGGALHKFCKGLFDASAKPQPGTDIKIINTAGSFDELDAAAKHIIYLTRERGYNYSDIAVTARTLEDYKDDIFDVFSQNLIPLNTALGFSAADNALGSFILNLLALSAHNFNRDDVLAVVCAPYFKNAKRRWPALAAAAGIEGGYNQWLDLLPYAANFNGEDSVQDAQLLRETINNIKHNLEALAQAGSFSELAAKAKDFISCVLNTAALQEEDRSVLKSVWAAIEEIAGFEPVRKEAQAGEFLEELLQMLGKITLQRISPVYGGVTLADTMTLRGQSFKAVIILGLNEGAFPSAAQEDPVLKDNYRQDLQKLGLPILKKKDRYSEERLLFYFALSSAREHACLIYQRSDYNAKPKIPSIYISGEALRLLGTDLNNADIFVQSRRPFEKYARQPFKYLTKKEAALACAVYAQDKAAILYSVMQPADAAAFEADFFAAKTLNTRHALTEFDGLLGPQNIIAQQAQGRGLSPSKLRVLYGCPAQFMFDFITGGYADEPLSRTALAPKATGNICHKILEDFYGYIKAHNLLGNIFSVGAADILGQIAAPALAPENYKQHGMYPLLWERQAKEILETLTNFVQADLQDMEQKGYAPQFFEQKLTAAIDIKGRPLLLRGTLDRVDICGNNYRITDYKKSVAAADVKKSIFRDGVFQPPLYFEMARKSDLFKNLTPASMQLADLKTAKNRVLEYDDYLAFKDKFDGLVLTLLDIIGQGVFVLTPNEYCKYCAYEAVCRKQNRNTLVRNTRSKEALKLKEYHAA